MGYEERMEAMGDNNSEQYATGRAEVVHEIYQFFKNATKLLWWKEEILKALSDFDG